jgi:hypothetical protein
MTKHSYWLWATVLLLGWAFDFLFWEKLVGINFAIFIAISLLGGFLFLGANGLKPALKSLWLITPIVFFAVITFMRQEPLTLFLAYTLTLFSMGILAVTYLGGRWMEYSLLDLFYKFFTLLASLLSRAVIFFSQVRKEQAEQGETKLKLPILPVLRGLAIALPIVVCFTILLASGDLVFGQKLSDFFDQFRLGKITEYINRLIIILFWAYILAGAFLHAATQSQDKKLIGEEKPVIKQFLGFTEAAVVLSCVAVLFLLFVIVQFRYFFGANANIGVEGFTYSQYARRGFNELVIVAFLSLLLILSLSTIAKRESPLRRRVYSGLSIAIVAMVMVILVSAYQRIELAIDWHGFSRLRLYPQVFLVWVGILLVVVAILEALHRERYFATAAVLASLGFAASLSFFNVDDSIVRHNVLRAAQGKHFNPSYLATLSIDAIPALAEKFADPSLSTPIHEGLGAALLCQLQTDNYYLATTNHDWRSFNLSRWNATKSIVKIQSNLQFYHLNDGRSPMRVRTPSNVLYECIDAEQNNRD